MSICLVDSRSSQGIAFQPAILYNNNNGDKFCGAVTQLFCYKYA